MQHAGGSTGNLRANVDTLLTRSFGDVVHLVAFERCSRGGDQRDRPVGFGRKLLDPRPLVIITQMIRNHLEDAVLETFHGKTQGQHLIAAGKGARHMDAMFVFVQPGSRTGKAQCTGFDTFAHQLLHFGELRLGRQIVGCVAAFAHHVSPHCAMRDLGGDVDGSSGLLQRVQIFREGLPLPVDTFGQRCTGDVFHPFHQLDQVLLITRPNRGKTDPAVAHDDGGHAVPAGWREDRVPGCLTVVMRVNVDPAGGDQQAGGIDFCDRRAVDGPYGKNVLSGDCDVAKKAGVTRSIDDGAAADDQVVHVASTFILFHMPSRVSFLARGVHLEAWDRRMPGVNSLIQQICGKTE